MKRKEFVEHTANTLMGATSERHGVNILPALQLVAMVEPQYRMRGWVSEKRVGKKNGQPSKKNLKRANKLHLLLLLLLYQSCQ